VRDNGLPAKAWTHVADLDPWLADAALDALRRAGVAAYITPHPGRPGAYLDVHLPDRPTDRLYVEAGARERAAMVLAHLHEDTQQTEGAELTRGPTTPSDVDAAFAEIVARFEEGNEESAPGAPTLEPPGSRPAGRVVRDALSWDQLFDDEHLRAQDEPPASPEERYLPPPPPPVPRGTPLRRFAWAAVIGAPLVVLLCVLLSYRLEGWVGLLVVGAFVAGLVTLFATLDDTPDDGGSDDGAVV
jgi:hypothetical protein